MSKNRLFNNQPKIRLIVSVETETVAAIDRLIRYPSANRSEFVRLAIEEKLERDVVLFQNRASVAP
jgi:metal-responsive CopG/Arc/MetJ family transcriptional regulator